MLDFRANERQNAGDKRSRTGRMYWESINKELAQNQSPFCVLHNVLRDLQEFIFMGPDIHTVCDLHDQCANST